MKQFPPGIRFKYPWRKYQQRVLNELEVYKKDNHLHIVAPPGSGKTVLGLQLCLELQQPVLILAPTLAIRDQWADRFCELFLQQATLPDWISFDIRKPSLMTIVTYQGLHAACSNFKGPSTEDPDSGADTVETSGSVNNPSLESLLKKLRSAGIKTIIADEAHHLKNEWWHTLFAVKDRLQPVVIGLTATPPYDVSWAEWQRYTLMNGPVDAEITIPELIQEGDLCPHQDHIFYTVPTTEESRELHQFKAEAEKIMQSLKTDSGLIAAIEQHPVWTAPLSCLEWIYENMEQYMAFLVFMQHNQKEIPQAHKEITDNPGYPVPVLDERWLGILVKCFLYDPHPASNAFNQQRRQLEAHLKKAGILERKEISFTENSRINALLASCINKLKAIEQIVSFEYKQAGPGTRCVILSDYIRKEFLAAEKENNTPINKLGVVPVFETLRRSNNNNKKLGVLTGSLVIIPQTALPLLNAIASPGSFSTTPLSYDTRYLLLTITAGSRQSAVSLVTHLFQRGAIEVLTGTKSLLGEGWDAPEINTLVLASTVGSFVLSNQMRGRAIRAVRTDPGKTANIWHLACVYPALQNGGSDYQAVARRLKGFAGISSGEPPIIENGIARLDPPADLTDASLLDVHTQKSFARAQERRILKERWTAAIAKGSQLTDALKIPFKEKRPYEQTQKLYLFRTIRNLFFLIALAFVHFLQDALIAYLKLFKAVHSGAGLTLFISIFSLGGIVIFGGATFKAFKIYIKYRDIALDLKHIGDALLNTLIYTGAIKSPEEKLRVVATKEKAGAVFCHLEGATSLERSVFMDALFELVDPVTNPRYIIIRKSRLFFFVTQEDYHAVPRLLGRHQHAAGYFRKQWQTQVGRCELVYTRTQEGRKLLLYARLKSLAAVLENKPEHTSKWI
ncbi:DEAD/DEAH box helicase family protein [Niabella beijingensis]|uniref:DEAD/DEAH box helicase family protein n=1 Tax=Niabella beijingensis TaxID=2872700 RepID=UPI001CBB0B58|nr:DEAD/DEAH box helicase family protein [Niabella beijingensis]MBZ4187932.1 DEAD/DEAH box helicase family protein [Niabella beijingensis]